MGVWGWGSSFEPRHSCSVTTSLTSVGLEVRGLQEMLFTVLKAISSQEACPHMASHPSTSYFLLLSVDCRAFPWSCALCEEGRESRAVSAGGGSHGYHVAGTTPRHCDGDASTLSDK